MHNHRIGRLILGFSTLVCLAFVGATSADGGAKAPTIPSDISGTAGVKSYLMQVLQQINTAAADLKKAGAEYDALVAANGGTPTAATQTKGAEMAKLISQMRDAYQRIDSFGYEYIEGIVAGVPALMKYDVELDAGVPKKKAELQDNIADVVIKSGDLTIDHEGSLNNFLIEPTVFGTNPEFISGKANLPGMTEPVGLPRTGLVVSLADYAVARYGALTKDAEAWQPTDRDCFHVLANMTPTLADYFDDWKESKKYGSASGGRFVAVSRISDMRGIMSSTRLAWLAVSDEVKGKDTALADKVSLGYTQILTFIDTIEARENAKPLQTETIDALGSQAREKADKLTVQVSEAAALMNVDVNTK